MKSIIVGLSGEQILFDGGERFAECTADALKFLIGERFLMTFLKAMLNANVKKILKSEQGRSIALIHHALENLISDENTTVDVFVRHDAVEIVDLNSHD